MTEAEHLMTIAAEECAEVAHRISKALRFGMEEIQSDTTANPDGLTNRDRILHEYWQLRATLGRRLQYGDGASTLLGLTPNQG